MKYAIKDHNNSVGPIVTAMQELGHTPNTVTPDLVLLDHDSPPFYRRIIAQYPDAKIVVYPHGEPVACAGYDGMWEPHERTAA